MTYAMAGSLQTAVYQHLLADTGLQALIGTAIYDAPPPGPLPSTYVSLGEEEVREAGDGSGAGARHDFTISVVSDAAGFATAKAVAAQVSDLLAGASLTLTRGRLIGLFFLRARARRVGSGDLRRIDLRFRARTEDD